MPFRLPGWVADRFTHTPGRAGQLQGAGAPLLFFPAWWALEAALAWRLAGPAAALAVLIAAPLTGSGRSCASATGGGFVRARWARRFAERAALRDTRAALRRQIRDVVGARP